jgi:hypothetical protein
MRTLVLVVATLFLPTAALADTADAPLTVSVELTETLKKSSQTVTFTLGLAQQGGCAEATSESAELEYHVKVCRGRGDVLDFQVDQVERAKSGTRSRRLRVSSQLTSGKRAVIGKILRGDEATEVAATLD